MGVFNNLRTQSKLFVAFGMVLILFSIATYIGFKGLRDISNNANVLYSETYKFSVGVARIGSNLNAVRAQLVSMMGTKEKATLDKQNAKLQTITKKIDDEFADMLDHQYTEDAVEQEQMINMIKDIQEPWLAFRETRDNGIIPALYAGDVATAKGLALGINAERYRKFTELADSSLADEEREGAIYARNSKEQAESSIRMFIACGIISIILAVIMSILLARIISVPLNDLSRVMERMAQGDLTQSMDLKRTDEIGEISHSFNQMGEALRAMIKDIKESANSIATASEQISSSTEELASGADNQSRQSNEIATAMEEMASSVQGTFTNSQKSSDISEKTAETAQKGGDIVSRTMAGMSRIEQSVGGSSEKIQTLGERSIQIVRIVEVIKEIAAQTNLLALNAAIEASRAGEHGRGFEVVAEEIRKLAEKSAESTLQITEIVEEIQTDTGSAVDSMKQVTNEVEEGTKLSNETGEALNEIISQVKDTVDSITLVADASKQQASVSDEVAASMESMTGIIKETAAGTEEIAQTAGELARLGDNLQRMTEKFTI